jgi:glycogen synthase
MLEMTDSPAAAAVRIPSRRTRAPRASLRRVLLTTDTVGGIWTFALDLCRGLERCGIEVVLAALGAPVSASQRQEVAAVPRVRLEEWTGKLEWMDDATADVARASDWLQALEAKYRPDVVHLNSYAPAARSWSAPVVITAHSCVATWWRAVHREDPPSSFEHYTTGLRAGLDAAQHVVAPTAAFLAAFASAHGALRSSEVVLNGRDASLFHHGDKAPFFLSVGRLWDPAKNARMLAEIAPELPWPVRVAGAATGPDGRSLELPNLELLGRCPPERVARLMARAAVYVLPARYEPFGLSILEAALSGCALVLGDIPTLREVWGEAAWYVPPDEPAALRDVLCTLAQDPGQRTALGEHARQRAARYSVDAMTRAYLRVYRNLSALNSSVAAVPAEAVST